MRRTTALPLVIAHRGASGYMPEHTLPGYLLAIEQGADYIEPDLVFTRDGVLVARHENEIGGTTDVATRPEFCDRRVSKVVDGESVTGWFTEDFTLAELKTLRARERLPALRPDNRRFDDQFLIPTFEEVLALIASANKERAVRAELRGVRPPPPLGVYPETKHPSYFAALGFEFDTPLLASLARYGYRHSTDPVFIQSFEVENLRRLRGKTRLPMVQLIAREGQPYDFTRLGDTRSYADLLANDGLKFVSQYANAIGPDKACLLEPQPRSGRRSSYRATDLGRRAQRAGLGVHVWTVRAENEFLPRAWRCGRQPGARGNVVAEIRALLAAGATGIFADQPALAVAVRDRWSRHRAVRTR